MGAVPQISPPDTSYLASLGRNISGLDSCNCPISFLFWWWPTAKALFFLPRHVKNTARNVCLPELRKPPQETPHSGTQRLREHPS
jgi:hypothetical protein